MKEVYEKLGNLLKLERERQNITLSSISDELKISESNLESVESGRDEDLPSDLYFKLFAKSYAEALGIDYVKTVDAIKEDLGITDIEEVSDTKEAPMTDKDEKADQKKKKRKKQAPADEAEEDEEDETSGIKKKIITLSIVIVGSFAIVIVLLSFLCDTPPEDFLLDSADTTEEPVDDVETTETPSDVAGFNWNVPEVTAPSPLTLKLVAREQSWATILSDGDTVVFRNLVPWREYNLEAKYRFLVSIAHPRLVQVSLNGQDVDLRDPESRRISRVEVNQINAEKFLNAPPPEQAPQRRQERVTPTTTVDGEAQPVQPQETPAPQDTTTEQTVNTEPDTTVANETD